MTLNWSGSLLSLAVVGASACLFGQAVYVANNGASNVSAYTINPATGALAAVPGGQFPAGDGPDAIVVDPTGKFVYVANSDSSISAYNVNFNNGALTAIPGSPFPTSLKAQTGPRISIDPGGKFVYLATASNVITNPTGNMGIRH